VTSFVIAAVGAGIAGGLMAIMRDGTPIVNPDNYGFAASFDAITMVILGGSGSVSGAALGGVFITFSIKAIEQLQSSGAVQSLKNVVEGIDLNALRMIVYALVLVVLMIWRPEGLLGERELFGGPSRGAPDGSGGGPKPDDAPSSDAADAPSKAA
jgi:branched-chain amino acid transport system permease protein